MENSLKISKSTNEDDADKSMHLSLSSASQVASNIDLLAEFLTLLPVKSLLRFKSVSKQWLSLISDSHFASKHFIQNPHFSVAGLLAVYKLSCYDCEFFFLDGRDVREDAMYPLENLPVCTPDLEILQSCNGLILWKSGIFEGFHRPYNLKYHIYNLCTKQCKTLSALPPYPFNSSDSRYRISVNLAFDPLKSSHYKLVWIWEYCKANGPIDSYQIYIYSSKNDSWRLSEGEFDAPMGSCQKSGVFCNGSLTWITDFLAGFSLCYIIDQELAKRVPMPCIPDVGAKTSNIYLGECLGHLYFVKSNGSRRLTSLVILEMEKDFSAWTVKYCVGFEVLPTAFLQRGQGLFRNYHQTESFCSRGSRVLLVQQEGDHFKLVLVVPTGQVLSYNTKDMKSEEIYTLGGNFSGGVVIHQFIESLAHV